MAFLCALSCCSQARAQLRPALALALQRRADRPQTVTTCARMPRTRSAQDVGIVCARHGPHALKRARSRGSQRRANLQELAKPNQVDGLKRACAHAGHRRGRFLGIDEFPPRRGARQGRRSVHVQCGVSHALRWRDKHSRFRAVGVAIFQGRSLLPSMFAVIGRPGFHEVGLTCPRSGRGTANSFNKTKQTRTIFRAQNRFVPWGKSSTRGN